MSKTGAKGKNQGEGNIEAARAYNKEATAFANSGKVAKKAEEAEKALDGPEAASLKAAENEGKSKARR